MYCYLLLLETELIVIKPHDIIDNIRCKKDDTLDAFTGTLLEHEQGVVYRSSIELYEIIYNVRK